MFLEFTESDKPEVGVKYRLIEEWLFARQAGERETLAGLCEQMLPCFKEAHPGLAEKIEKTINDIVIPF